MQPRFAGRLGVADGVTAINAMLGFMAAAAATIDLDLAARLLLLAAVADGLDGVLARVHGSTQVGEYIDSLADVASFCVAPAMFIFGVTQAGWTYSLGEPSIRTAAALFVPALFVAAGVIRLGLYTAYDIGERYTEGVQTTLAGTILAAAYLAGVRDPVVLLGATAIFAYLMVTTIEYPELHNRDAVAMGAVQGLAILVPGALGRAFPRVLLVAALAYLVFSPVAYWRAS
jgi:CDP-diacylglycerol--serine O-phosphatidyltransferase